MSLSDIMGAMHVPLYAEVGLVVFVALFAGVLVNLFSRRNRAIFDRARFLPLEEDSIAATDAETGRERTTRHHA
jgi:cbb3-type cytochrome oxidase subunit 3